MTNRHSAADERLHPLWLCVDAVLALVVLLFAAAAAAGQPGRPGWHVVSVALLVGAPVAVRRRWPGPALLAISLGLAALMIPGSDQPSAAVLFLLAPGLVLYRLGRSDETDLNVWSVFVFAGLTLVLTIGYPLAGRWSLETAGGFGFWTALVCGLAFTAGRAVHERTSGTGPVPRRARSDATVRPTDIAAESAAAQRSRVGTELRELAADRLGRIAADTHRIAAAEPANDSARRAADDSASLLRDVRALLNRLGDAPDDSWRTVRQPDLSDLDAIVARAGQAGVGVTVNRAPDLPVVPHGVETAVYHVIQESVSNVVNHSIARRCVVTVSGDPERIRVEITDPGPLHTTGPDGDGIAGMRLRVENLGGEFSARPADGGFAVTALIPVPAPGR